MKISERQYYLLMDVLRSTLNIVGLDCVIDKEQRLQLLNDLVNQQSEKLIELEKTDE